MMPLLMLSLFILRTISPLTKGTLKLLGLKMLSLHMSHYIRRINSLILTVFTRILNYFELFRDWIYL